MDVEWFMNAAKRGHIAVTPYCAFGSDCEAEPEVCHSVVVLLSVSGSGAARTTRRGFVVPVTPAATTTSSGAGSPGRANVGLLDEVVDLHGGGFAGQAGESPAAIAASHDFSLSFCEYFEHGHCVR
jgi:hypothetical protein